MTLKNIRILGFAGIAGAPWMLIDFMETALFTRFKDTTESGIFNLLFVTGWMCSVYALYKLKAAGNTRWGSLILRLQLFFLALTNCWSIYEIVLPQDKTWLYGTLSYFWTVGGYFMIVTGFAVLLARKLPGWKRYPPLLAGLWLPIAFYLLPGFFGLTLITLVLSGTYATLFFGLMGFSVVASTYDSTFTQRTTRLKPGRL